MVDTRPQLQPALLEIVSDDHSIASIREKSLICRYPGAQDKGGKVLWNYGECARTCATIEIYRPMRKYYDNWQDEEFDCPACRWHGPGSALVLGDYNWESAERLCPVCEELITVVLHPTVEESRANWDKVSEWDRKNIERAEARQIEFERRKLREPSQLPGIHEPSFTLHWDFIDDGSRRETLIKYGDSVIFTEPALYEGYERFVQVAEILHNRYGTALRDLVPTPASKLYLYGDHSGAPQIVAAARERIFSI